MGVFPALKRTGLSRQLFPVLLHPSKHTNNRRPRLLPAVDSHHQNIQALAAPGRIFCRDQAYASNWFHFFPRHTGNIRKAQAAKPPAPNSSIYLEQAGDLAVLIHVDPLCSGNLGKTGHGHDLTGEGNQEAGAGSDLDVPYRDGKAHRSAQLGLIVREGILGLAMQMGILS